MELKKDFYLHCWYILLYFYLKNKLIIKMKNLTKKELLEIQGGVIPVIYAGCIKSDRVYLATSFY